MVTPHPLDNSILNQLHLNILPNATSQAFLCCAALPFFNTGGWYLAGGTALALQAGHRRSVDLDFFTAKKTFNEKQAAEYLSRQGDWKTTSLDCGTLYGKLAGAKISLISYPFFKPSQPLLSVGSIRVLTLPDIAAMKIVAISQRGRKRDFIDIYWLATHGQGLEQSIKAALRQYNVSQNLSHILKSLVYFNDADNDPMPSLFFKTNWKTVKQYLRREVTKTAKKLLKL
ncbi:hypothetical protein COU00_02525 [Candidatus Falkowbacteria bacterium CG10_big_fil_rev_8_21_14_0_10_43_11]|uniref:Nucleotidyl transferase AbiEii/AbiGii toxin family protein n=1 Tax=Candidatus Falkowbacteria bacterium CG10_big_fil_rev_8_21_14_0_10_43_11 TaxID=1974568 RepID=A0A2M6WLR6_9BACT|nr:MAG: hypothetical protein COU00_02525 [Candidatus Falkowbacteria bacterium CG10_big_fil_rev_8_21_14_0_10_43_11]